MGIRTRIVRTVFGLGIAAALVVGASAFFTPIAEARGRCICPHVYAPVVCDNGKTYPNQCFANCRNGKNCVPADIF